MWLKGRNGIIQETERVGKVKMKKCLVILYGGYGFGLNEKIIYTRTYKILSHLEEQYKITILTQGKIKNSYQKGSMLIETVDSWYPKTIIDLLNKLRLGKLISLLIPFNGEQAFFWVFPAILRGWNLIRAERPDVIVTFMMPYSLGLVSLALKFLTDIPVILNFDDSPTCTDMGGNCFPTWFHYKMTLWMENFYVQQSNAVIYVSKINLDNVKERQKLDHQGKFHLIRYGADLRDFFPYDEITKDDYCQFQIVYIGFMTGWFEFHKTSEEESLLKKIYRKWNEFGQYKILDLEMKSSSPIFIGKAVQEVVRENPNWGGKIKVNCYGNGYPQPIIDKVLLNHDLTGIVNVYDTVPNDQAIRIACSADLLFLTLPTRPSDSPPGGRISAKTYEYLATDRPIIAAVCEGENRNYLEGKPGVFIVHPKDISGMAKVLKKMIGSKFSKEPLCFNRSYLNQELSYTNKASEFARVFEEVMMS